jgi:hypothetical protein
MLTIAEQLLLLALHDEKGSVVFSASTALPYGLAGATLVELFLAQRIAVIGKKVQVLDSTPLGDEILDEALQLIQASAKPRDLKYWVQRVHDKLKHLKDRLADNLVQKGLLSREEHRWLKVFSSTRYPTENIGPEYEMRHTLRSIVLLGQEPTDRELALIGLVKACELVNELFAKPERREAKKRIKELTEAEMVGKAVAAVVAEITAATMTVVIAASASSS